MVRVFAPGAAWESVQRMVRRSRFLRNVGVMTAGNAVVLALNLAGAVLLARWLGPSLYGLAALAMSYPSLVFAVFDARSSEASVKYLSQFHSLRQPRRALAMCILGSGVDVAIASLCLLSVVITAPWAARWIAHRQAAGWLMTVYAVSYLPRAFGNTSYAVLATLGRFPLIALIDAVSSTLRVGLAVALVAAGWKAAGVVWGTSLAMAVGGVFSGVVAYRLASTTWGPIRVAGSWAALGPKRREIVGFLAFNEITTLADMIPKQLDTVLLGHFRTSTEVGYYKLGKGLMGIVGSIVGPLQGVAYPELARLCGIGDEVRVRETARRLAWHAGIPLGLSIAVCTLAVPAVLPLVVGHAYRPAITGVQWLLAGSAVWLMFFWLRPLFFARGAVRAWMGISVGSALVSALGFFAIIPAWGFTGLAAWTTAITIMGHAVALRYLWREERERARVTVRQGVL